jgi:hypothetical protein
MPEEASSNPNNVLQTVREAVPTGALSGMPDDVVHAAHAALDTVVLLAVGHERQK